MACSPYARRLLLAMLAGGLAISGCKQSSPRPDAGAAKAPPTAEERFGNDPELVADFNALSKCAQGSGHLDHACPQLRALLLRLQTKQRTARLKEKLVTTLTNLLESKVERTRLMAAASAEPHLGEADLRRALQAAWETEEAPAVKALLLRQLCRAPGANGGLLARTTLASKVEQAAVVRAAAATCLGRASGKARLAAGEALRKLLGDQGDASPQVKGDACEALSRLGDKAAVPALAAQLGDPKIAWRCATALAAMGGKEAFEALLAHTQARVERGPLPAQQLRALASFSGQPFVDAEPLKQVLKQAAGGKEQGEETRAVAKEELARIR